MGLDMYLSGKKFFVGTIKPRVIVDGLEKAEEIYNIAYWRKHPNLHGYIIQNFANGEDNCQEIDLSKGDLEKIIEAIKTKDLPPTTGFFFGTSYSDNDDENNELDAESIKKLESAIKFLSNVEEDVWKSVVYQASW